MMYFNRGFFYLIFEIKILDIIILILSKIFFEFIVIFVCFRKIKRNQTYFLYFFTFYNKK